MAIQRVSFRGVTVDAQTAAMLREAERLIGRAFDPVQGSFSDGPASAGTHSGAGAVDLSARRLGGPQIDAIVGALRTVGFAAWYRTPSEGPWPAHIHAIAVDGPGLSRSAARQVELYRDGRSGLASNRPDKHARLGIAPTTWARYLNRKDDDDVTPEDIKAIAAAVWEADVIPHMKPTDRHTPNNPRNPEWKPKNSLELTDRLVRVLVDQLDALNAKVDALAAELRGS